MTHLFAREAVESDLDYLVWADLQSEGYTVTDPPQPTVDELVGHREKIGTFVTDGDKGAWVLEAQSDGDMAGMILFRFRSRCESLGDPNAWLFQELPRNIFPADGRFCEVFNLRVEPGYRRHGYATLLKKRMEGVARQRGVSLLYTHTEETNTHVLELNMKLGYVEVRRGPIWDEVCRVSLVKRLDNDDKPIGEE